MPFAVSGAYDALIYIAPMIALKADDVRPAGESFQAATDEAIREALDRWDVPHMTVDVVTGRPCRTLSTGSPAAADNADRRSTRQSDGSWLRLNRP